MNVPQSNVIGTLVVLLKIIYMHENIDERVLQMRFILYLTENTVCLYDGAGETRLFQESCGT